LALLLNGFGNDEITRKCPLSQTRRESSPANRQSGKPKRPATNGRASALLDPAIVVSFVSSLLEHKYHRKFGLKMGHSKGIKAQERRLVAQ
jgi:hypothetical protein